MEDIVQRVFAIMFAVIVLFVMPLYMTFEKKDDISYALALKITSNFVNSVRAKGYLTQEMYDEFISELAVTDNYYEVKMLYKHKSYDPVIIVRNKDNEIVETVDYSIYKEELYSGSDKKPSLKIKKYDRAKDEVDYYTYRVEDGYKFEHTYKLSEVIYNEEQILKYFRQQDEKINYFTMKLSEYSALDKNKIPDNPVNYVTVEEKAIFKMSVGDEFTVAIRNTNMTIASILFDALTFGGIAKDMPRVYINYGAVVKNTEYTELADEFARFDDRFLTSEEMKDAFQKYSSTPSVRFYYGKDQVLIKSADQIPSGTEFHTKCVRGYTTKIYF